MAQNPQTQIKSMHPNLAKFESKMERAGFYKRGLQVELPCRVDHEGLPNGDAYRDMNVFMRLGYKIEEMFKDPMRGVRYPEGYCVFNRNRNGEQSNFFVIARHDAISGVELMFTNPRDPDKGGTSLKKGEVVVRMNSGIRTASGFEKWAERAIAFIAQVSQNKPADKYYAQMHGHWGYSREKLLMDLKIDDGRSHEISAILNFALWHVDFDATGPHNHHFPPLFQDVKMLEAAIGIVKVPAAEITMPVRLFDNFSVERFVRELNSRRSSLGIPESERISLPEMVNGRYMLSRVLKLMNKHYDRVAEYNSSLVGCMTPVFLPIPEVNGPHIMMYSKSEGLMEEIQSIYFSRRTLDYPPFAPIVQMESFMKRMQKRYGKGVAFMIAHPSCSHNLPAVGLLNRISRGDIDLVGAERTVKNYAQAVGAFNPSLSADELLLFIPYSKEKLTSILREKGKLIYQEEVRMALSISAARGHFNELIAEGDRELGTGKMPTHNTINMLWAREMRKKYGISTVYDADEHLYLPIRMDRNYIGSAGFGRTAISGNIEMSAEAFISALHSAKETGTPNIEAEIFWDRKNDFGRLDITRERLNDTLWEKAVKIWNEYRIYGIHGVPFLAKDFYNSLNGENPHSPQEFIHAALRVMR